MPPPPLILLCAGHADLQRPSEKGRPVQIRERCDAKKVADRTDVELAEQVSRGQLLLPRLDSLLADLDGPADVLVVGTDQSAARPKKAHTDTLHHARVLAAYAKTRGLKGRAAVVKADAGWLHTLLGPVSAELGEAVVTAAREEREIVVVRPGGTPALGLAVLLTSLALAARPGAALRVVWIYEKKDGTSKIPVDVSTIGLGAALTDLGPGPAMRDVGIELVRHRRLGELADLLRSLPSGDQPLGDAADAAHVAAALERLDPARVEKDDLPRLRKRLLQEPPAISTADAAAISRLQGELAQRRECEVQRDLAAAEALAARQGGRLEAAVANLSILDKQRSKGARAEPVFAFWEAVHVLRDEVVHWPKDDDAPLRVDPSTLEPLEDLGPWESRISELGAAPQDLAGTLAEATLTRMAGRTEPNPEAGERGVATLIVPVSERLVSIADVGNSDLHRFAKTPGKHAIGLNLRELGTEMKKMTPCERAQQFEFDPLETAALRLDQLGFKRIDKVVLVGTDPPQKDLRDSGPLAEAIAPAVTCRLRHLDLDCLDFDGTRTEARFVRAPLDAGELFDGADRVAREVAEASSGGLVVIDVVGPQELRLGLTLGCLRHAGARALILANPESRNPEIVPLADACASVRAQVSWRALDGALARAGLADTLAEELARRAKEAPQDAKEGLRLAAELAELAGDLQDLILPCAQRLDDINALNEHEVPDIARVLGELRSASGSDASPAGRDLTRVRVLMAEVDRELDGAASGAGVLNALLRVRLIKEGLVYVAVREILDADTPREALDQLGVTDFDGVKAVWSQPKCVPPHTPVEDPWRWSAQVAQKLLRCAGTERKTCRGHCPVRDWSLQQRVGPPSRVARDLRMLARIEERSRAGWVVAANTIAHEPAVRDKELGKRWRKESIEWSADVARLWRLWAAKEKWVGELREPRLRANEGDRPWEGLLALFLRHRETPPPDTSLPAVRVLLDEAVRQADLARPLLFTAPTQDELIAP